MSHEHLVLNHLYLLKKRVKHNVHCKQKSEGKVSVYYQYPVYGKLSFLSNYKCELFDFLQEQTESQAEVQQPTMERLHMETHLT